MPRLRRPKSSHGIAARMADKLRKRNAVPVSETQQARKRSEAARMGHRKSRKRVRTVQIGTVAHQLGEIVFQRFRKLVRGSGFGTEGQLQFLLREQVDQHIRNLLLPLPCNLPEGAVPVIGMPRRVKDNGIRAEGLRTAPPFFKNPAFPERIAQSFQNALESSLHHAHRKIHRRISGSDGIWIKIGGDAQSFRETAFNRGQQCSSCPAVFGPVR